MKIVQITGELTVDDGCSYGEGILRLAIRLKQIAHQNGAIFDGEFPDWEGDIRLKDK